MIYIVLKHDKQMLESTKVSTHNCKNKSLALDSAGVFHWAIPQRTQMITRHIQIYTCKHLQILFITYTLIHIYPHTHFIGIAQKEIWNKRHCKEYKNTFIVSYCMIFLSCVLLMDMPLYLHRLITNWHSLWQRWWRRRNE